jgi:glucan biosynthesis protein
MKKQGYLYIMEIDGSPGVLKIGMTKRDPDIRAKELANYEALRVAYAVGVPNASIAEKILHDTFQAFRDRKEYYRVDLELVKGIAHSMAETLWEAHKNVAQSRLDNLRVRAYQLALELEIARF